MHSRDSIITAKLPHVKQAAAFAVFALLVSAPLFADTVDFENMPQTYWYNGGQQNFGNYWQGVNFGPQSTILEDQVYGYNSGGYPPHSGHAVLFSISTPYIDAVLDVPVDNVSLWYTSTTLFYVDAYDALDNLVDSALGLPNSGTNSYLQVSSGSSNIKRVRMHDTGNFFTVDDFTAPFITGEPTIPEPGTMTLFGLGMAVGVLQIRRRLSR